MKPKPIIPLDALAPEFLEGVRRQYVQGDETSKAFQIASQDLDDSDRRQYLDMALKRGGLSVRSVLLGMLADPEETSLADRARAAALFLHGYRAGFWTATPQEADQARAVAFTHYGDEPMLHKIKDDLAREVGLPTRDFVSVKPKHKAVSKAEKSANDLLILVATEAEYLAHALDHGTAVEKLAAIGRWFYIFGPNFPADMIQDVGARLKPN